MYYDQWAFHIIIILNLYVVGLNFLNLEKSNIWNINNVIYYNVEKYQIFLGFNKYILYINGHNLVSKTFIIFA